MMQSCSPQSTRLAWGGVVLLLALAAWPAARAQTAEPAPAPDDASAKERAHKEGDKVFKWILMHADKPKRAETKPAAATPAPSPAPVPRAAVRVKDEGITETVTPIVPPSPPKAVAAAPARGAAAEPAPALAAKPASSPAEGTALALAAPKAASAAQVPLPMPAPEPEDAEVPLTLVHQVNPEFPSAVMRRLGKGSVQVRFEVQPDGSVKDTEVVKTSHHRLNEAAQQAVAQWRFMPLKHVQYGMVELAFNLDE